MTSHQRLSLFALTEEAYIWLIRDQGRREQAEDGKQRLTAIKATSDVRAHSRQPKCTERCAYAAAST